MESCVSKALQGLLFFYMTIFQVPLSWGRLHSTSSPECQSANLEYPLPEQQRPTYKLRAITSDFSTWPSWFHRQLQEVEVRPGSKRPARPEEHPATLSVCSVQWPPQGVIQENQQYLANKHFPRPGSTKSPRRMPDSQ